MPRALAAAPAARSYSAAVAGLQPRRITPGWPGGWCWEQHWRSGFCSAELGSLRVQSC